MFKEDVIIMVGLPLSGKSTAVDSIIKSPMTDHYTIVCPDDVRMAMHGQEFFGPAEPMVWGVVDVMARSLLSRDKKIIVDSTNVTNWERNNWIRLAEKMGKTWGIFHIDTSREECVRRAKADNRYGMIQVIERIADKFEPIERFQE